MKRLTNSHKKLKSGFCLAAFPSGKGVFFDEENIREFTGSFNAAIFPGLPQTAAERLGNQAHSLKY